MSDFFLQYVTQHALAPGRVENWTVIFDFSGVGVTGIKKEHIQGIVKNMTINFRGRLFKMFCINVNWWFRGAWKMAHRFVDEFTKRKVLIYGNDF